MKDLTREQVFEYYRRLPEDLKEAITSVESSDAIYEIGRKYGLTIGRTGELAREVGGVLLGITHPKDFVSNLQTSLEVDRQKASEIAREVNSRIFKQIQENLKKLHGISTGQIEFVPPLPAQPKPPPKPPLPTARPEASGVGTPSAGVGAPPFGGPTKPPVIFQFSAEPNSIERGKSITLRWSVSDAQEVWIDPDIGSVPSTGTRQVSPTHTTKYTLSAKSAGGQTTRTVTVNVSTPQGAPPVPHPLREPARPDFGGEPGRAAGGAIEGKAPPPQPIKPRLEAIVRPESQPPAPPPPFSSQPARPSDGATPGPQGPQPLRIKPDTTAFGDISKAEGGTDEILRIRSTPAKPSVSPLAHPPAPTVPSGPAGGSSLPTPSSKTPPTSTVPPGQAEAARPTPQPPASLPLQDDEEKEAPKAKSFDLKDLPKMGEKKDNYKDYYREDPYKEQIE